MEIRVNVPGDMKKEAEMVLSEIGLSMPEAIRLFLKQTINCGGIPFKPIAKRPSLDTISAIKELEIGNGQSFNSSNELFSSWKDN